MSFKSIKKKIRKNNSSSGFTLQDQQQMLYILANWDPLKPIPYSFYKRFNPTAWTLACGNQAVYQIITNELVIFLNHLIKNKNAIEVCCGLGTLGRSLGIPFTDRKVNEIEAVRLQYSLTEDFYNKQITYPDDVIQLTAHQAINKYKPDVVIGCWVTQKLLPGSKIGSMYGPIEEKFVRSSMYVHCGSGQADVHLKKRINKIPHYVVEAPWIVSRDSHKAQSKISIWTNERIDFDAFPNVLEFDYYDV